MYNLFANGTSGAWYYIKCAAYILAGIGALIIASKMLSSNIEKLANGKLKSIFKKSSNNKFVGVGIGVGATALVQNSTAITVMVVGFTNTGLMTLSQAACVIMGANIGTTIVGQLAALGTFEITPFFVALTAIGVFISMFAKKDKIKTLGSAIAALGLFFLSLELMSSSIKAINTNGVLTDLIAAIKNPLLLLLIGFAVTALVQSSGAVTGILVGMAMAVDSFGKDNSVLFIILGTNIGTTVTAMISAIGTTTNAKRAALIHFMFNLFGTVLWFVILLVWKNFMHQVLGWCPNDAVRLAMFHTLFNTICTLIFLPFSDILFVRLSKLLIRDKKAGGKTLTYMDERFISSPPIALSQLGRETVRMSNMAIENMNTAFNGFLEKDISSADDIKKQYENIVEINKEITEYLVKISSSSISLNDEHYVSALHYVVGDVLRVSELSNNIEKHTENMVEHDLEFSDSVKAELKEMCDKINAVYVDVALAFSNRDKKMLPSIDKQESEINAMRNRLVESHIKRLNEGECKPENSGVFINLVNNMERIADHLNHMAHAIEYKKA